MAPSLRLSPLVGNHQVQVVVHRVAEAWQRGQAPKGLLKLKQARFRFAPWAMAVRALECAAESQTGGALPFPPRRFFQRSPRHPPVCGLDRVHDARPIFSADGNAVQKHKHWQREVQIEQRLGRGELEDPALLPQAN